MTKINSGLWVAIAKIGLKVLKVVGKLSKFLLAGTSFAAYAYLYSWKFAILIILMLLIHEYGHLWAMKKCGMKTKGIYLIPFFGGAAVADEAFKTRWDEVYVAIMGPIFGLALSVISAIAYYITENPLFAAAASWMAMVNLLNMLPVNPLDGGRIMKSVFFSFNRWAGLAFMVLGLAAGFFITISLGWWLFAFMIVVSSLELAFEIITWRNHNKLELLRAEVHLSMDQAAAESIALLEPYKAKAQELKERAERDGIVVENPAWEVLEQRRKEIETARIEGKARLIAEIDEVAAKTNYKERMSMPYIVYSVLLYVGVSAILGIVMYITSHQPGADLASEFLK